MKKAIGILVCILTLLVCVGAMADVTINEMNFPDANFRQFIQEEGFDANGNGILSNSEIAGVTIIWCPQKGIKTLKGIEHFTALNELYCYSNELTSLDVSRNTALTVLWCHSNKLTSLDVSKNTALTYLACGDIQIKSLDVSKNTALTRLVCNNNQLKSLDVSKNTALIALYCDNTQLTNLDVSKNMSSTSENVSRNWEH